MIVDGNNFIGHYLKNNKPLCAGKIGITELNLLYCNYLILQGQPLLEHLKHEAEDIAGLYPYNQTTTKQFSKLLELSLEQVDLIPKWNKVIPQFEEYIFNLHCQKAYKTKLEHLEPYYFDEPWTKYLDGKTVLVVSPFADSIQNNYLKLDKIWSNKITPNFKLKTLKYPFALPISDKTFYKDSNEVFQTYLAYIKADNFDVGIFGTGYTSLLFAAECKKMGKMGIHLGGATQILFGIKGQRWRDIPNVSKFFNEYWTDPLDSEKPQKRDLVEGGAYW